MEDLLYDVSTRYYIETTVYSTNRSRIPVNFSTCSKRITQSRGQLQQRRPIKRYSHDYYYWRFLFFSISRICVAYKYTRVYNKESNGEVLHNLIYSLLDNFLDLNYYWFNEKHYLFPRCSSFMHLLVARLSLLVCI